MPAAATASPDLLVVLEGLFLLNWKKGGLDIFVPAAREHVVQVAQTNDLGLKGRKDLPAAPSYKIAGIQPGEFTLTPQFHDNHFSFKDVEMADYPEPHTVIADLPRPVAVHGGERFEVDRKLMLDTTPDILYTTSSQVRFCEQTVLEFKTSGKVQLLSGKASYSPVMVKGRQVLAIYAEPRTQHGAHGAHGGHGVVGFNSLLKMKKGGQRPNFALTGLKRGQTRPLAPDAAIATFGLPSTFKMQIDGTGCGAGSKNGDK